MYGMVNRAIEDLVCERFGRDAWESICEAAGVEDSIFIANESYPDEVTYKLVGAASRALGVGAGDVLELFGEHWIRHTAAEGYGGLLEATGDTLEEFLENLPDFHSRVMLLFPGLRPPRFETETVEDGVIRVRYWSEREGLAPFVTGLLRGLGELHDTAVEVEHAVPRGEDDHDHDVFHVRWTERAA